MDCLICKQGRTQPGRTTVTLQRGDSTVIFRGAPAQICDNCGEYYLDEATSTLLLERAEQAVRNGAEVEIQRFAA